MLAQKMAQSCFVGVTANRWIIWIGLQAGQWASQVHSINKHHIGQPNLKSIYLVMQKFQKKIFCIFYPYLSLIGEGGAKNICIEESSASVTIKILV